MRLQYCPREGINTEIDIGKCERTLTHARGDMLRVWWGPLNSSREMPTGPTLCSRSSLQSAECRQVIQHFNADPYQAFSGVGRSGEYVADPALAAPWASVSHARGAEL